MKNKILPLLLSLTMLVGVFNGCNNESEKVKSKVKEQAQLVIAVNPTIAYDDGSYNLAFNDIKNAIYNDMKSATLTSLSNSTPWNWVYANGENWQKRAVYDLAKWKNGFGAQSKKNSAYAFNDDSTISMFSYTRKASNLTAYNDNVLDDYGLVLSATGEKEEAVCYTAEKDGSITILSGNVTAIEKINGVKTGFLSEDGTKRSAAVKIRVNNKVYWSDTLLNSTASEDGNAVTQLTYPDISNIPVTEGDLIFISVQLNATANKTEDVTLPDNDDDDDTFDDEPVISSPQETPDDKNKGYSIIDGFEARFTVTYPYKTDSETEALAEEFKEMLEKNHGAEQIVKNDGFDPTEYEILLGLTNREESKKVYDELINARANNASDFIVRTVGKKVVIAATTTVSLKNAIEYFVNTCAKDDKGVVPTDLNYVKRDKKTPIIIAGANIATYSILTEKYPSYMTLSAAKELQEFIINVTGYVVKIEKGTANNASVIQIGPRAGGLELLSNENDYEIYLNGTTLSFKVGSSSAVNFAVKEFIKDLENGKNITAGYSKKGSYKTGSYALTSGYEVTWNDEFTGDYRNGDKVDKNKWRPDGETTNGPWYKIETVSDLVNNDIGGPWFTQLDVPEILDGMIQQGMNYLNTVDGEGFFLRDNNLVQVAKKVPEGFSGVRLNTINTMNFRYGFYECRQICATANGAVSAIWFNGHKGEIDLLENYGLDNFYSNIHSWRVSGIEGGHINHVGVGDVPKIVNSPSKGESFSDTYHHYGLEWTDDFIAFYLDGEKYLEVDTTDEYWDSFDEYMNIRISSGAGGSNYSQGYSPAYYLGEDVDDFYVEQVVDFVRVYQKNDKAYKLRSK